MKRYKVYEKYGAGAKERNDERDAVAEKTGAAGEAALREMIVERALKNLWETEYVEITRVFRFVGGHLYQEVLYKGEVFLAYIEDTGLREREVDGKKVWVSVRDTQEWSGFWLQKEIELRGQQMLNLGE